MRNLVLTSIFILVSCFAYTQSKDSLATKYLEDQIYLGITSNILSNKPQNISPNGFSNGVFIGFIKDIPINKNRNFGFGLGLGYGRNTYFQDLKISEINNSTVFEPVDGAFDRNKFSLHSLEVPIELRWRTSTSQRYKFWRIYTGVKLGYIFASNAKLKQDQTISVQNISEVQ